LKDIYDIAIIGGGINGCGIARDAAGRGLAVYLAEQGDLAGGTSSASTKLIHGGLRYLEQYEFGLVREALREREVLWAMAPHIIHPMRFVLPHQKGLRPAWLIRIGLFLYDHLGKRERLPGSTYLNLTKDEAGGPLRSHLKKGFEYSDCWVDDARLVVLNAVDAAENGADIETRTEVLSARRVDGLWLLEVANRSSGRRQTVTSRALVNASGPWISEVASERVATAGKAATRLVKGSHIVVPRIFDHDRAYIFQHPDGRVVFAIPYEGDYTLIGTTDVDYDARPEDVRAEEEEIRYLCAAIGEYFSHPVSPDDVVWSYSGVRPLYDDGTSSAQETTREYVLEVDGRRDEAPVLSIFGGKITTYRVLAEEALAKLASWFPKMGRTWTEGAPLPGGDFDVAAEDRLADDISARHPALPDSLVARLARSYGTRAFDLLSGVEEVGDLGRHFGADLYEKEAAYLVEAEWARTAEDILWRRSKLGLRLSETEQQNLAAWLEDLAAVAS
jgi:glycerol-3-phosphate dehydrogenase